MNKKIIFSVVALMMLISGVVAGIYLVQKNQDIREKAAPATVLSLTPNTQSKNPGQTFNLTVNANTGENKITGVDIEIVFNPEVMQITQMTPMSGISNLSTIVKNGVVDNTSGKARFVAFTALKDQAVSGDLNIISITGTIKNTASSGNYQIGFSNVTTLAAADEGQNVLVSKLPATITVSSGGSLSPTPTPTQESGIGGSNFTFPTATPNKTATPTTVSTSKATLPPDIPVTGNSFVYVASVGFGVVVIISSLLLAF